MGKRKDLSPEKNDKLAFYSSVVTLTRRSS